MSLCLASEKSYVDSATQVHPIPKTMFFGSTCGFCDTKLNCRKKILSAKKELQRAVVEYKGKLIRLNAQIMTVEFHCLSHSDPCIENATYTVLTNSRQTVLIIFVPFSLGFFASHHSGFLSLSFLVRISVVLCAWGYSHASNRFRSGCSLTWDSVFWL